MLAPPKSVTLWNDEIIPPAEAIAEALRCPFRLRRNAHAAEAQQRSEAWLIASFDDDVWTARACESAFGWFAGGLYPDTGLGELCAAADYLAWTAHVRELAQQTPAARWPARLEELVGRLDAVFDGARAGAAADRTTRALATIVERIALLITPRQMQVFVKSNRAYLGGLVWEAINRADGRVPDDVVFTSLRPVTGALLPLLSLVTPFERIELTEAVRSHPLVTELARLTANMISSSQDALAYARDRDTGNAHNMAVVFEVRRRLQPGAALRETVKRHNADAAQFVRIATSLPAFGRADYVQLRRYVSILESMMRATLEWGMGSRRPEAHGVGATSAITRTSAA